MPPNLRSVIAQRYYLGGRSIWSRRNFSSSIESKKDRPNLSYTTVTSGFGKYISIGMCLYCVWDIKNAIPKWKKIEEEHQLVKQRLLELPLKAVAELRNKLTSEEKFP